MRFGGYARVVFRPYWWSRYRRWYWPLHSSVALSHSSGTAVAPVVPRVTWFGGILHLLTVRPTNESIGHGYFQLHYTMNGSFIGSWERQDIHGGRYKPFAQELALSHTLHPTSPGSNISGVGIVRGGYPR